MLSFVFVQNPFDRLVSVYNEKILKNPLGPWKSVIQEIIRDYRSKQKKKLTNFETMVPRYNYFRGSYHLLHRKLFYAKMVMVLHLAGAVMEHFLEGSAQ